MNPQAASLRDQIDTLLQAAEFDQLIEICKPALNDARARRDTESEALALIGWALAHQYLGKFVEARILADGAIGFARESGTPELLVMALNTSASLHLRGYFRAEDAENEYRTALRIAHEAGDELGTSACLTGIGASLLNAGDTTRARRFGLEAFDIAREQQSPYLMAVALSLVGSTMIEVEESENALKAFQDALKIVQDNGIRLIESSIIGNIGTVLLQSERYYEEGLSMMERALQDAQDIDCVPHEFSALNRLGLAYQRLGRFDAARDYYETMLTRAQTWGARAYEGAAFYALAMLAHNREDDAEAISNLEQALIISRETMNPYREAQLESQLAMFHANQRRYNEALTHYSTARTIYDSLDDDVRVRQMTQVLVMTHLQRVWDRLLRLLGIRRKQEN